MSRPRPDRPSPSLSTASRQRRSGSPRVRAAQFRVPSSTRATGRVARPDHLSGLPAGLHTFDVRATDAAGNTDQSRPCGTGRCEPAAPVSEIAASRYGTGRRVPRSGAAGSTPRSTRRVCADGWSRQPRRIVVTTSSPVRRSPAGQAPAGGSDTRISTHVQSTPLQLRSRSRRSGPSWHEVSRDAWRMELRAKSVREYGERADRLRSSTPRETPATPSAPSG